MLKGFAISLGLNAKQESDIAYRKTPIGFLHRLVWIHVPSGLLTLDNYATGGRLSHGLQRAGNYLMNEAHPLVLVGGYLLPWTRLTCF